MKNPDSREQGLLPPVIDVACFRDPWFWALAMLGPLAWLSLAWLFGQPLTFAAGYTVLSLVLLIVIYPLLEELVFRGALQSWFLGYSITRSAWFGVSLANLLTSLVFTALHFISQPPLWATLVFFPSLVFGWTRDRYQSLTAAIVLHGFFNAGFLLLFG